MATPFLGEIRAFSFSFAPESWALCNDQTLPINQYTALFSLLGTNFGGNGTTTFNLPDLQGRLALGSGLVVGEAVGEAFHTLVAVEMPAHDPPAPVPGRTPAKAGVRGIALATVRR
jgi:microcystin-dependent protein